MIKKIFLYFVIGIILFSAKAYPDDQKRKPSISSKITYAQKYMWRGFDLQKGAPAVQPEIVMNLGGTGPYFGIWGNYAMDGQWHAWDEMDFYVGYLFTLNADKYYVMEMDASYTYYYFPNQHRDEDSHEVALSLKLPKLIPQIGKASLVPRLTSYYGWSPKGYDTFWLKLGADYEIPIHPLLKQKEQTLALYVETFYNDGYRPFEVSRGWGHVAAGLKTTFEWQGIGFIPSVNYQRTLKSSVNEHKNVFWYTFGISYEL
jgi:uncharacterized protein (TIGR02001 family)